MRLETLNEVRTEDIFFFDYNPQFKFDFKTNIYIKGDYIMNSSENLRNALR